MNQSNDVDCLMTVIIPVILGVCHSIVQLFFLKMTITKEEGGAQLTKGGTSFKKHKNKEIKDESINQSKIEKSKNEWRYIRYGTFAVICYDLNYY